MVETVGTLLTQNIDLTRLLPLTYDVKTPIPPVDLCTAIGTRVLGQVAVRAL